MSSARNRLRIALKVLAAIAALAIVYLLLDFSIDIRPPGIQESYGFRVGALAEDEARILRQDNLSILVIRRSSATVARLLQPNARLQDPLSLYSSQPDFAANPLRSRIPEYFVSYAIGTDYGCALQIVAAGVREICGDASYDFAGRALGGEREFKNLPVPDYNFSADFQRLTVRP